MKKVTVMIALSFALGPLQGFTQSAATKDEFASRKEKYSKLAKKTEEEFLNQQGAKVAADASKWVQAAAEEIGEEVGTGLILDQGSDLFPKMLDRSMGDYENRFISLNNELLICQLNGWFLTSGMSDATLECYDDHGNKYSRSSRHMRLDNFGKKKAK